MMKLTGNPFDRKALAAIIPTVPTAGAGAMRAILSPMADLKD